MEVHLEQCTETLSRVRDILYDERLGNHSFNCYQDLITGILKRGSNRGYLYHKEIAYLEKIYQYYRRIVDMNASFDANFRNSASDLLEGVVNLAEKNPKISRLAKIAKGRTKRRAEQIKRGDYFWDLHVGEAVLLLNYLKKDSVAVGDLEHKVGALLKSVSVERGW